jgi:hypothetical protein
MLVFQLPYFDSRILEAGYGFTVGLSSVLNGGACEVQDIYFIGLFSLPFPPTRFRST